MRMVKKYASIAFFFWMNYDQELRMAVDVQYSEHGYFVASYVSECSDAHDVKSCERGIDGTCYLCDYLNKKVIKNILMPEMIYPNGTPDDSTDTLKEATSTDYVQVAKNVAEQIYFQERVDAPQKFKIPRKIFI